MCAKLFSAKTERSGRVCSSPRKTSYNLSPKTGDYIGLAAPLASASDRYHTILLFHALGRPAEVCCATTQQIPVDLTQARGIHGAWLRKAFSGQMCHYEWNMDQTPQEDLCQTTLVPLTGKDGKVSQVLCLIRTISSWVSRSENLSLMREGVPARTFSQILLAAREMEKRAVAKTLHDEIGSTSVMLSALVNLVKQSIEKGNHPQALADLARLHEQMKDSIERLRTVIVSMRPPSLETDGALRGSIEELIENVCTLGRLQYRFDCAARLHEKGVCDSVKILLYRMVQEALSNVIKHAHATKVVVSLARRKNRLFLTVQDNGVGFEKEKRLSVKHVGLLSMRDSVRSLGGRITITSAPGKGTQIAAVCPCAVYEEFHEN